jgi:hypothetical protein
MFAAGAMATSWIEPLPLIDLVATDGADANGVALVGGVVATGVSLAASSCATDFFSSVAATDPPAGRLGAGADGRVACGGGSALASARIGALVVRATTPKRRSLDSGDPGQIKRVTTAATAPIKPNFNQLPNEKAQWPVRPVVDLPRVRRTSAWKRARTAGESSIGSPPSSRRFRA